MKKSSRRVRRQAVRKTRRLRGGGGCFGWMCKSNKNTGAVEPSAQMIVNPMQTTPKKSIEQLTAELNAAMAPIQEEIQQKYAAMQAFSNNAARRTRESIEQHRKMMNESREKRKAMFAKVAGSPRRTRRLRGGGGCLGGLCKWNKTAMAAAVEVPGRRPNNAVVSTANPMRASGAAGGAPGPALSAINSALLDNKRLRNRYTKRIAFLPTEITALEAKAANANSKQNAPKAQLFRTMIQQKREELNTAIQQKEVLLAKIAELEAAQQAP